MEQSVIMDNQVHNRLGCVEQSWNNRDKAWNIAWNTGRIYTCGNEGGGGGECDAWMREKGAYKRRLKTPNFHKIFGIFHQKKYILTISRPCGNLNPERGSRYV